MPWLWLWRPGCRPIITWSSATTSLAKSPLVSPLSSFSRSFLYTEEKETQRKFLHTLEFQSPRQPKETHKICMQRRCRPAAFWSAGTRSPSASPRRYPNPAHTYARIMRAHTRSGRHVWGQRAHRHGLLKAIGVVFLRRHQQAEQQSGQISRHSLLHSTFQVLEHTQNYHIILAGPQKTERNEALWLL